VTGLRKGQERHELEKALRQRSDANSRVGDATQAREDRREAEEIRRVLNGDPDPSPPDPLLD
jgi:hypothetical protein